jgi:hypothetical protein
MGSGDSTRNAHAAVAVEFTNKKFRRRGHPKFRGFSVIGIDSRFHFSLIQTGLERWHIQLFCPCVISQISS